MNWRKMRIFYEVAQCLNMTRVSEKFYISQSSVSQTISEIENELNVKLFDRINKKLYLTNEGKIFLSYVRRILNIYDEATEYIKDINLLEGGTLKLGASKTVGVYIIPYVIKAFSNEYGNVDINTTIDNTNKICELIKKNEIDLAIVEGEVNDDEILVNDLYTDELVVIAPANHKWKEYDYIDKEDILKEKLVLREPDSGTRQLVDSAFNAADLNINNYMELGDNEAIKKAVQLGIGVSCISFKCVEEEIKNGSLVMTRIEGIDLKRKITFIVHKDKYLNVTMNELIRIAKKIQ